MSRDVPEQDQWQLIVSAAEPVRAPSRACGDAYAGGSTSPIAPCSDRANPSSTSRAAPASSPASLRSASARPGVSARSMSTRRCWPSRAAASARRSDDRVARGERTGTAVQPARSTSRTWSARSAVLPRPSTRAQRDASRARSWRPARPQRVRPIEHNPATHALADALDRHVDPERPSRSAPSTHCRTSTSCAGWCRAPGFRERSRSARERAPCASRASAETVAVQLSVMPLARLLARDDAGVEAADGRGPGRGC